MNALGGRRFDAADHFAAGIGDGHQDGGRFLLGLGPQLLGRGIGRRLTAREGLALALLPLGAVAVLQVVSNDGAEGRVGGGIKTAALIVGAEIAIGNIG